MMPPENFNAFGNRGGNLLNFGRYSNSSSSSNDRLSTSSSATYAFHIDGFLTLYSPTFVFHDLQELLLNSDSDSIPHHLDHDKFYLTIMPRVIKNYDGKPIRKKSIEVS